MHRNKNSDGENGISLSVELRMYIHPSSVKTSRMSYCCHQGVEEKKLKS